MSDFQSLLNDATVVSYGTIPLVALLISAYSQLEQNVSIFSIRPNACGELFSFTLALDATLLLNKSSVLNRVNPGLAAHYEEWLVLLLLTSFVLLIFSGRTQSRIKRKSRSSPYPFLAVAVSWMFGIAFTGVHLFLLVGK